MSISEADIIFAYELFDELGPLTSRKMMGGWCLYHSGTIFSILHSDGSIWLKGAGQSADVKIQENWERWRYTRKDGKKVEMPYWKLPDYVLEDPEEASRLAKEALADL